MLRHVTTRVSGLIIVIAGLWGGLIPFVGPYFHFVLGPDHAWRWTTGRLWLSVLPAAAAVFGGLVLLGAGPRVSGKIGALIALAGGVWFAIGPDVSRLWNHGLTQQGATHGRHVITRVLELLTLHTGIGVLITAFAAYALPGVAAYGYGRRRAERDAAIAGTGAAAGAAEERHRDRVSAREGAVGAGAGAAAGAGAGTLAAREDEPVTARDEEPAAAREDEPVTARDEAPAAARESEPVTARDEAPAAARESEPVTARGGGTATQATQTTQAPATTARPRRRGGLAGIFSRR